MEDVEREQIAKLARVETIALALQDDIKNLRATIMSSQTNIVSRGEWLQRNGLVDQRFQDMGREISTLRTKHESDITSVIAKHEADMAALAAQKTPWYQSFSVAIAALGVIAAFIAVFIK